MTRANGLSVLSYHSESATHCILTSSKQQPVQRADAILAPTTTAAKGSLMCIFAMLEYRFRLSLCRCYCCLIDGSRKAIGNIVKEQGRTVARQVIVCFLWNVLQWRTIHIRAYVYGGLNSRTRRLCFSDPGHTSAQRNLIWWSTSDSTCTAHVDPEAPKTSPRGQNV